MCTGKPLRELIDTPKLLIKGPIEHTQALQLHCLYHSLSLFQTKHKRLPSPVSVEDLKEVMRYTHTMADKMDKRLKPKPKPG